MSNPSRPLGSARALACAALLLLAAHAVAAPTTPAVAAYAEVSATATANAAPANAATSAIALPADVERGPSLAGIDEYRLQNGLKVLLMPDPSKDQITLNVTYLVGSRYEGYGERGMAHLLEHMMFKGTPRHPDPKTTLLQYGADYNGTTSYDRTNYFETFNADAHTLSALLDFEADRMVNSRVSAQDLASEMTVVRNEFEAGENRPAVLLGQRMNAAAYMWHNYGRNVIGTRSDIENVPIERLQSFYHRYYRPDNAVLIVAGRFDEAAALNEIARLYGPIPKPAEPLVPTYTVEPPQDGEREVTLRRAGDVQMVGAMYHVPAGSHPDFAAVDVLTELLTTQPSGRLHRALIETGQAASTYGYSRQLHDPGSVFFGAIVQKDASLDQARDTLLHTVEGFAATPVTDEEVARARTALQNDMEMLLTSTKDIALTLSEFASMGDWRLLFWYRDQLAKVTRDDVQRVATTYLRPANRTLGLFHPTAQPVSVSIPQAPNIAELVAGLKDDADVARGEAFDPTPANIEARLVRRTLPSGIKLAMLPKKTRGATVRLQLGLHWGTPQSRANRHAVCSVAGAMLSRGTTQHSRAQLRDALEKLRATVSVGTQSASIVTVRDNLPDALALVVEMLRQPSFPQSEFEQVKRELITALEAQRNDPSALAGLDIARHLNPYPPQAWNYTPTLDESIARIRAVTLDDARRCHDDLMDAAHADVAIVGDFDPDAMAAQIQTLLGDWKKDAPYQRVVNAYHDVAATENTVQTPDKANAVLRGGFNLALRDDDADFPALLLGSWLIGGSPDARLARRVREKEGLSYSVGAWLDAHTLDRSAAFKVYAICAPQNITRVEAGIRDELQRALAGGFDATEFERGRQALLQARQIARNSDGNLAARMAKYTFADRTFAWDSALEKSIAALTPAEVLDALRRHFDLSKLSVVKAGDFKAVAAQAKP